MLAFRKFRSLGVAEEGVEVDFPGLLVVEDDGDAATGAGDAAVGDEHGFAGFVVEEDADE
ncbi:hypothetical protein [Butyricimonas sp. Marseille-P3923]|uniref:hypothetical protein n=1 Tax=Butyricimonas sp. Marseille-P3923 TaxID=1987504 RepID=UPI000C0874B2|nr:hypothetical protein [Butyricimonas sp. Marseille-P3923]